MKNEELLNEALSEICEEEFSAFDDMPEYDFPKSFDKKMSRLFGRSAKPERKRIKLFVAVGFAAAAVLICGASVVLDVLFHTDMNDSEYISISAESLRNAPKKIDHYYEPDIPDHYIPDERYGDFCTELSYTICYVNKDNKNDQLIFSQYVIGSINFIFKQDQHEGSPQWIKIDDPKNNSFDMVLDHSSGYHFIMDHVEHFWTDGKYIYSVKADRAVVDSLDLNDLHEVFPEVHEPGYYSKIENSDEKGENE